MSISALGEYGEFAVVSLTRTSVETHLIKISELDNTPDENKREKTPNEIKKFFLRMVMISNLSLSRPIFYKQMVLDPNSL